MSPKVFAYSYVTHLGHVKVYVEPDAQGESAVYEAYRLCGYLGSRRQWHEGLRKDRAEMYPDIRPDVERALAQCKWWANDI